MDFTAKSRFLRITPRKAMLVADLVRGKSLNEAYAVLAANKKRGVVFVRKLLDSAQHNATDRDTKVDPDALYIKEIVVGRGPIMKRFHPRAKGRGVPILKRMSHLRVVLAAREAPKTDGRKRGARSREKGKASEAQQAGAPAAPGPGT